MPENLTPKDIADLREYLAKWEELGKREKPTSLTTTEWEEAMAEIRATGEIPEKYKGRIGERETVTHIDSRNSYQDEAGKWHSHSFYVPEGKNLRGFYDMATEEWERPYDELLLEYHDLIMKALVSPITAEHTTDGKPSPVLELLGALVEQAQEPQGNLLLQEYLPLLNADPANDLIQLSTKYMAQNKVTGVATYTDPKGNKITINGFSDISSCLGTSADKIFHTAILYLTNANYYKGSHVTPTATIPLLEYFRKQEKYNIDPKDDSEEEANRVENQIKYLKNQLRKDLDAIMRLEWSGYIGKSKVGAMRYISSWRYLRGNQLRINFDADFASMLVHSYMTQYPTALLKIDNHDPNSYAIGCKIFTHHSMDSNAAAGTQNTLSVRSLLEAAPEIPSYESLVASNNRNWKRLIKSKLDSSLNTLVSIGYLSRWEYRQPRAKSITRYSAAEAGSLTWDKYSSLMVDFTVSVEPDQAERRARRSAEAEARKAADDAKPKKKRGRPPKKKAEE